MQWLALVIHVHENDIRTLVKDCLKLPLLVMGTPLIQNSQVGNVLFTTADASAGDMYSIVLECIKTYATV